MNLFLDEIEQTAIERIQKLNHSFMPFTAKQGKLYLKFREKYDLIHNKNNNL